MCFCTLMTSLGKELASTTHHNTKHRVDNNITLLLSRRKTYDVFFWLGKDASQVHSNSIVDRAARLVNDKLTHLY